LSNVLYKKKQARSTFKRIQVLWNKQDRSSQIADEIHNSLDIYFQIFNMTRRNSTFRAIQCRWWLSGDQKNEANDLLQSEIGATPNLQSNVDIYC